MFYKIATDGLSKVKDNIELHRKRLHEFNKKGVLFMAGPLVIPAEGTLGIFTNIEAK